MKSRITVSEKRTRPRQSAGASQAATVPSSTRASVEPLSRKDVQHRIAKRAYELYESRGREDGRALEDWLSAEEEILREDVSWEIRKPLLQMMS